jgi:hypothetical protein
MLAYLASGNKPVTGIRPYRVGCNAKNLGGLGWIKETHPVLMIEPRLAPFQRRCRHRGYQGTGSRRYLLTVG